MAYGIVRDHGEASLDDKKKLATDFFADTKITLDWPDSHTDSLGISISLKMSRLIFNLLVVASGALVRGGTVAVRISQDEANAKHISIIASGSNLKWDSEMDKVFAGNLTVSELSPKNVQAYLTKRFAEELEATLTCRIENDKLVMQVTQSSGTQTTTD